MAVKLKAREIRIRRTYVSLKVLNQYFMTSDLVQLLKLGQYLTTKCVQWSNVDNERVGVSYIDVSNYFVSACHLSKYV